MREQGRAQSLRKRSSTAISLAATTMRARRPRRNSSWRKCITARAAGGDFSSRNRHRQRRQSLFIGGCGRFSGDVCEVLGRRVATSCRSFSYRTSQARSCEASKFPQIDGRSYNLFDIPLLTAREYLAELQRLAGTPLAVHYRPIWRFYLSDLAKWGVKLAVAPPRPDSNPKLSGLGVAVRSKCAFRLPARSDGPRVVRRLQTVSVSSMKASGALWSRGLQRVSK